MREPGTAVTRRASPAGPVPAAAAPAGPVPDRPDHREPAATERTSAAGLRAGLLVAAVGLSLVALGAVLGTVGAFLNDVAPRVLGVGVPVGTVLAVVGNLGAGLLGSRGTGSRLGGGLPALGWFTVVGLLGTLRAEGDLVVTGDGRGVTFIVAGALAAAAALLPGAGSPRADHSKRP